MSSEEIKKFQKHILFWFSKHKRDLPWRQTRDPYKILVSEVMLQQTQVSRVIPKYNAWLKKFPTLQDLAHASKQEVLLLWSGLGYNRRALYLQNCSQEIVEKHDGIFPQSEQELLQLPGVGKYTARALLCFAFGKQIAVVDTNIRKVILTQIPSVSRETKSQIPNEKEIQAIADALLPKGKAYEWNQALMDYASSELKHKKIAMKKQSPFKNSDRFYRGKIVKFFTQKGHLEEREIYELFEKEVGKKRLEEIIIKLRKDNFF